MSHLRRHGAVAAVVTYASCFLETNFPLCMRAALVPGIQSGSVGQYMLSQILSRTRITGGFLKVFRVQNGKFVLVMSQGINFIVTSQRIFHFGWLDAY
jgi:hypothetical protein